ncbi:MAG TPA: gamma-glutamyl-gamma-aminobutyrate hydrolase family protein [Candidatus Acidoferrum sp.]|jgi:putative glutamine amidotransferase
MTPDMTPEESRQRPRIGIPWDTAEAEATHNSRKISEYEEAVRKAGGEPILLSLSKPAELQSTLPSLDAFVLPGSPADIKPADYGAPDLGLSAPADPLREQADRAILKSALAEHKPVLAVCFGCQLLNVYLGGSLIQDLRQETGTKTPHRRKDLTPEPNADPQHPATFEAGSRLEKIVGGTQAEINSSHHQAIADPGKNLRITARATDGTVEAVEWTGDSNWVIGVQWHPERMTGDPFSDRLFGEFISAARAVRKSAAETHK